MPQKRARPDLGWSSCLFLLGLLLAHYQDTQVFSFFFPPLLGQISFLQISEHFVKVLRSALLSPLTSFCLRAHCWSEHTAQAGKHPLWELGSHFTINFRLPCFCLWLYNLLSPSLLVTEESYEPLSLSNNLINASHLYFRGQLVVVPGRTGEQEDQERRTGWNTHTHTHTHTQWIP